MSKEVKITLESLDKILNYLINRPYKEVAVLIKDTKDSIREIESEEVEQTPKP